MDDTEAVYSFPSLLKREYKGGFEDGMYGF